MDPAISPQGNFRPRAHGSQVKFPICPALPGFEGLEARDRKLSAHKHLVLRQVYRQIAATRLAHRIAGREVHLERGPGGLLLIDSALDQIVVDASIGGSDAERMAALLLLGAEDRNHLVGTFDSKDGDTFAGCGSLFKPSLRMDPNYMEAMRRRLNLLSDSWPARVSCRRVRALAKTIP